ncbi:glycine cleavage system protein GcvH [Paenibacillus filicis]|uniref:Glycine cleavage system H protein n=1 Tax=Paenibacillus gyeongsangnamensis TaxID=3388067 RepID=A0ABT4Q2G2_9BACL|nr:glycine cleavage system protein GcvH [Paenibacillus filicis]MCZ8511007.1 glycine cleavage system protein GcvH [Paenibacillus filicis]
MSVIKPGLRYTEEHEWAEPADSRIVRIGITDFAQSQLGDIVFVEFPEVGDAVQTDQPMGTIESVKTVSDLFSPVNGTVIKVNEALLNSPEAVNEDPYGAGWMIEVELEGDAAEALTRLLTAEQYESFTASEG